MKKVKKVDGFYKRTAWGRWCDKADAARWQFFAYSRLGHALTALADKMHCKFPKSKLAADAWRFCLPF